MIASLRSSWILLGVLALGVVLACGEDRQGTEPAAQSPSEPWEPAPAPKPEPSDSSPVIVTTKLPADFPSDVPVYPGAKVIQARVGADAGTSVRFSVGDDAEKVLSYYADSLAAEGWSTDIKPDPEGSAIFADKSDRRVTTLVRSTDEGTQVDVIVTRTP